MTPQEQKRAIVLRQTRKAIEQHKFTATELSTPSEIDVIMVLLAISDFEIKMPYTNLAIICFIGSRGYATRKDLLALITKDYSTIARSLINLEHGGFLNIEVHPKTQEKKYTLSQEGINIFNRFTYFYQEKIIETNNLYAAMNWACADSHCTQSTHTLKSTTNE
jgi:DNA-binding MarR family transcriptional regulator